MRNLRVSMKLIISFLMIVVLTVIVGAAGIFGLTSMGKAADLMYSQKALPLGDLAGAIDYFQRCRVLSRDIILYANDTDKLKTVENDIQLNLSQFETAMAKFQPTITTEKGRELYTSVMDNYSVFKPVAMRLLDSAKQGAAQEELIVTMRGAGTAADRIAGDLSGLIGLRMTVMEETNDENTALQQMLLILIIAVIIVSAGVSMGLAFHISGLISKPLTLLTGFMNNAGSTGDIALRQEDVENIRVFAQNKDEIGRCIASCAAFVNRLQDVSAVLQTVADGDLTANIILLSEKDVMGQSVQKMVGNLNSMFGEIQSSTEQVSIGSKQIADGAQSLAQGSTEQAAAIEELSSSISGIAQKTKESAGIAANTAVLAGTIKSNAEKGSTQMDRLMEAVKEINEASKSISRVIKVIDDIAFQTNILALNAAVEAARAGQHGKGFAVVAEEVRSLAAKSAEAAKDTESLIANSIEKAELGTHIAGETAVSLSEIVSGINESAQLIGEIAKSSEEQSQSISQINKGIDQIAQVIQQNSATAEESAAASEEMSGQSSTLEELIGQFRLNDARGGIGMHTGAARKALAMPQKSAHNGGFGKY